MLNIYRSIIWADDLAQNWLQHTYKTITQIIMHQIHMFSLIISQKNSILWKIFSIKNDKELKTYIYLLPCKTLASTRTFCRESKHWVWSFAYHMSVRWMSHANQIFHIRFYLVNSLVWYHIEKSDMHVTLVW